MSDITRYEFIETQRGSYMKEKANGNIVKYEDVKHLIERDTAKKPEEDVLTDSAFNHVTLYYCPTCDCRLEKNHDNFCQTCGQCIDWSE